jgi:hypothetical protein
MLLKEIAFRGISMATIALNFLLSTLMRVLVTRMGLKTISEKNMQLC